MLGSKSDDGAFFQNEAVYVKRVKRTSIDWRKRSVLLELKLVGISL